MILSTTRCNYLTLLAAVLLTTCPASADVIYVDGDADGANSGSSWEDAYTDLQDALGVAISGDQIWVAQGTYKPAGPAGNVLATFQLLSGVGLYGGFAGGETELDQRDPEVNVTILSGDLNGDDGPDFANYDENSHHVVTGSDVDETALLDGFTVTAGHAYFGNGAGMIIEDGDPTLIQCLFFKNTCRGGSVAWGAGLFLHGGNPRLVACSFVDNLATESTEGLAMGGALYQFEGVASLVDCSFYGNQALYGGAIATDSQGPVILTNCVLSGNVGEASGGAILTYLGGIALMTNCTLANNTAAYGGGLALLGSSDEVTLTNTILWNNSDRGGANEEAQIYFFSGSLAIDYSCVQGWTGTLGGVGNIGTDPLFVDSPGPDGIPGTEDDDLHLSTGSPCIDAADNEAVPADEFDLDGDGDTTEPIPYDLDGDPRFVDDPATDDSGNGRLPIVDMGSYEFQVEDAPCDGDANGDGMVDPLDSGFVLSRFGCDVDAGDPDCDTADQNNDGEVDPLDVGFVLARFGPCE